jgi:hypothetical protein
MEKKKREKLATLCLIASTFFLPFGYDVLFAMIMKLTGSYWAADLFFYFLSALFFGLYIYYSGKNPFKNISFPWKKLK